MMKKFIHKTVFFFGHRNIGRLEKHLLINVIAGTNEQLMLLP